MVLREVLLCPPAMPHDWSSRSPLLPLSRAGALHASPFVACSAHSTNLPSRMARDWVPVLTAITIRRLPEPLGPQPIHSLREPHEWERNPLDLIKPSQQDGSNWEFL